MKPTTPRPVISTSTSRPGHRSSGPWSATWPTTYPISVATTMTVPPIVGVPRLVSVRGRALLPDRLAVAAPGEDPDRQRRAEQRQHHRDAGRDEDGLHGALLLRRSARARRVCRPTARDALTSTTSPGREPVGRARPPRPPRRAPAAARRARTARPWPRPGSARPPRRPRSARPGRPARPARPPARAVPRACAPSSVMWPSTANARAAAGHRGQRAAARRAIASGLAL